MYKKYNDFIKEFKDVTSTIDVLRAFLKLTKVQINLENKNIYKVNIEKELRHLIECLNNDSSFCKKQDIFDKALYKF